MTENEDQISQEQMIEEETAEAQAEQLEADPAAEAEQTKEDEEQPEPSEEDKLRAELAAANDKYLRLAAEYDNFRKRSAKERLELSASVRGDTVSEILPLFDNFERALQTETEDLAYKQGVEMIFKQFGDMIAKLGVEIIDPTGQPFDPNIANAISQIEDPELGENTVAQTYQKGYKIGDKVIRYAMVVVANP
ncbi:MAG: nucleotide exchange factor GrpE [Ruminococcus sp.]|nr:nucleotide exchange factor GrpE [Ruminococcus sp.]